MSSAVFLSTPTSNRIYNCKKAIRKSAHLKTEMETLKITAVVTGILMMLILNNVHCILVTKPSDAAVKIGDSVIMRCSSSYVNYTCEQIPWKHFKPNSDEGVYMNTHNQLSSMFDSYISIIDSGAGNCHLRINATPSAAGRYQCTDGTSDDPSDGIAALIVLENVPEIEITTKAHSGITALDCSVYYYGKWASKVQWVKIVGDSWTNVTANESESEIRKTPALILTQFSSLIKIPTNSVTEHFICNVTISEYHRPNTTIYAWKSLECGAAWNKTTKDEAYNDGFGYGIGIGFGIGFAICFCLCGIVFLMLWNHCFRRNDADVDKKDKRSTENQGL